LPRRICTRSIAVHITDQEISMTQDAVCTLVPYFKVREGQLAAFRASIPAYIERTRTEPGCVHYAFSFSGDIAHCREGYDDAAAVLAHLDNVGALLKQTLQIADIVRLEVHGPAAEVDKLHGPLADLKPQFFVLEPGGLRR
jgi:quinol monooxygenase YgiN